MTRSFASLAVLGILGCATAPTDPWEIGSVPERQPSYAAAPSLAPAEAGSYAELASPGEIGSSEELIPSESPATGFDLDPAGLAGAMDPSQSAPRVQQGPHRSRFTGKVGYYSYEDTDHLDDGYIIAVSWMNFLSPNFATEFELGYIDAEGKWAGADTDLWGIPFMLNGRFSVPVKALELYGGAGFGSIYYDLSVGSGLDADGWLAAADAFFGATITLKNSMVLGVEGKYWFTESDGALDGGLDAFALMLTVGFGR